MNLLRVRWLFRRVSNAYRRGGLREIFRVIARRARVGRLDRMSPAEEYREWRHRHVRKRRAAPHSAKTFRVLVFGTAGEATARATRESAAQAGANVEVEAVPPSAELSPAGRADFVTAVGDGDRFVAGALDELAAAAGDCDRIVAYADEDLAGPDVTRHLPFLKPAWSPLLSVTLPGLYPGAPLAVSAKLWDEIRRETDGRAPWPHLALLAADAADRVVHIPLPLLTRRYRGDRDPLLGAPDDRFSAAERAVDRRSWNGRLFRGARRATCRLCYDAAPPLPRISVIIPTRDQPDLLIPLGRHLERQREALPLDLVFVDHLTTDARAREYLDGLKSTGKAKVLRVDGRFNYARMINHGVRESAGSLLLLLNNDVEPLTDGWIETLAYTALQPGVAAAGALLFYPDHTIQHGAVALGIGTVAGHLHKYGPVRDDLPWVAADVSREVSAVTAACVLVRREAFDAAGGMDENELAVSYNDVDLCLKLTAAGHRVIYEPEARLIHHETVSRPNEVDPDEVKVMRRRWGPRLDADPYCPPGLHKLAELPHLELWEACDLSERSADGAGRLILDPTKRT